MILPASRSALNSQTELSSDPKTTVSLVICTRNRPLQLQSCLEAIGHLDPHPDEVLVVDNTEGDEETKAIALRYGARYSTAPTKGLSRARNRAMKESLCDVVAFLDDDAVPDEHWLRFLLEPFADPNVAAVTGSIRTPDMPPGTVEGRSPLLISQEVEEWFEVATFGGLGWGSNMALRRAACVSPKIFDERLGRGAPFQIAEENYAFAKLLSRGHTVAYIPAAVVNHPPLKRSNIEQEARNSITFWLLLFSEFPEQRIALLRFLIRRLQRKSLRWPRDPQGPGDIINSGWGVKLKAGFTGLFLFLKTPKPRDE